jgi:hypothetical protein
LDCASPLALSLRPGKPASATETERGSLSRSTSELQVLQFIPNTLCLAKLLRVADPRSAL